jgi:hypothetical protein
MHRGNEEALTRYKNASKNSTYYSCSYPSPYAIMSLGSHYVAGNSEGKERTVRKRRARQLEHPPFGRQVAFARVATGLGWTSLGALAVGASAAGAVAIGALAIRALAVRRARIKHLNIEELEVGRLHVRELVVEQEQTPQSRGQEGGGP